MRHSTLLFAASFALHASHHHVAVATGALAKTNQDHPFLETKNDIRSQRFLRSNDSSDHDERMTAWDPAFLSSTPPAQVFEKIVEVAGGEVHNVLQTMTTEEMKLVLAAFKKKDTLTDGVSLVDQFIGRWGIDAVAAVLVQAKTSDNSEVVLKGDMLLKNLMESLDSKAHGNYMEVFNQLKLNDVEMKHFVARVELLDDYIKHSSHRKQDDYALFSILRRGLGGKSFAHLIDLAMAEDKSAEALETRFLKQFLNHEAGASTLWHAVVFPFRMYNGLQQHQFRLMEKYFALEDIDSKEIPNKVLQKFIDGFGDEGHLAIAFAKAAGVPGFEGLPRKYEGLLFKRLWLRSIDLDNFGSIFPGMSNFSDEKRAIALVVKERYQKWSDDQKYWYRGYLEQKIKRFAEIEDITRERKRQRIAEHGNNV